MKKYAIKVEIPILPLYDINNIYGYIVTMNSDVMSRGIEHILFKKYFI